MPCVNYQPPDGSSSAEYEGIPDIISQSPVGKPHTRACLCGFPLTTVRAVVLEIGTAGSVSLNSNIHRKSGHPVSLISNLGSPKKFLFATPGGRGGQIQIPLISIPLLMAWRDKACAFAYWRLGSDWRDRVAATPRAHGIESYTVAERSISSGGGG